MILALILGLVTGIGATVLGIVWRWFWGQPTVVTSGGWNVGPFIWGAVGMLLGSLIALFEVLAGRRLIDTFGVRLIVSSVAGAVGGAIAWKVYTFLTNPSGTPSQPSVNTIGSGVLQAKK